MGLTSRGRSTLIASAVIAVVFVGASVLVAVPPLRHRAEAAGVLPTVRARAKGPRAAVTRAPTESAGGWLALSPTSGVEPTSALDPTSTAGEAPHLGGSSGTDPARASAAAAATSSTTTTEDGSDALEGAVREWLDTTPGMGAASVAVVVDGRVWTGDAHAGGEAVPAGLRAGDEYAVASLTKSLTIGLVLREAAAGTIDLDAPVPAVPGVEIASDAPAAAITPRELLQHTSGLVDYSLAEGFDQEQDLTPAAAVMLSLGTPLVSTPGTVAHYANSNYLWLGLLLEQVTGRSYGDLVASEAAVLGLTHTRLDPSGIPGWVGFSSGGVHSTIADMARWEQALATPGKVIPAAMVNALATIDDHGLGLGTWPLCPCSTGADGVTRAVAMGHYVADGGAYRYPDGMILVMHVDPPSAYSEAAIVALGQKLRSALGRP